MIRRALTVLAASIAVMLVGATAALAHVSVSSPGATQGGYATVTVKVPTESDTASTVGLKLQLPTDTPFSSVSVQPKPGWTIKMTKSKLPTPVKTDDGEVTEAISLIEWTASADAGIKPGEFDTFSISVGPLPKADSVTFKAIQTYSDGKVVNWVEEATGSTEPDFPAPTLAIGPANGEEHGHGSDTKEPAAAASDEANDGSNGLAITGVILGGLGLVAGLGALFLVTRKRPAKV